MLKLDPKVPPNNHQSSAETSTQITERVSQEHPPHLPPASPRSTTSTSTFRTRYPPRPEPDSHELSFVFPSALELRPCLAHRQLVKQFIRAVRSTKTLQDERSVVQKESAAIRASFREESGDQNVRSALPRLRSPAGRRTHSSTGETTLRSYFTCSLSASARISVKSNV